MEPKTLELQGAVFRLVGALKLKAAVELLQEWAALTTVPAPPRGARGWLALVVRRGLAVKRGLAVRQGLLVRTASVAAAAMRRTSAAGAA